MEKFNILEITKIAMDMEMEGQDFYRKAASLTKDEKLQGMFILLAEQEKKHLEQFQDLHRALAETSGLDDEYLFDENVSLYLRALVENTVFKDSQLTRIKAMDTMKDALGIGINSEKNSILFYNEIIRNTKSTEVITILSLIVEEEKKHLVDLSNLAGTI